MPAAARPTPLPERLPDGMRIESGTGEPFVVRRFLDFSIPVGPLDAALRRYGEITGMAVLVDDALVSGRSAAAVQGRFQADVALARLLEGSGLAPRYVGADAFTLELLPGAEPAAGTMVDAGDYGRAVQLQKSVEMALCRSSDARPGDYRAAIQVWFDADGRVNRSRLLDGTGSAQRDQAITAALDGLLLADPALAPMSPVTLLVLPVRPGLSAPCGQGARR